jgi:hypothetical protein
MASAHNRLQLATKIHFFLLRELGQGIDVERLLKGSSYARDVLLVCEACRGSVLADLAHQYRAATVTSAKSSAAVAPITAPGRTAQAPAWGADSSGFGASDLMAERTAPPPAARSWFTRLTGR